MQNFCIKRRMKRSVSVLSALALVCSSVIPVQAKAGNVTQIQCSSPLSEKGKTVKTTLTLKKGKTFRIKTKYAGKKVLYKSSKKKIAAVSKSGKITAKKIGKTKITVSPKGNKKVKAVITVTVVKSLKKVKKIKLNKKQLSLAEGTTEQLSATIVSPKKPTTKKINWISSNKKIASVNKKGVVTAKGSGTAKITAVAADGQGAKASCNVTVTKEGNNPNPQTTAPSVSPSSGTNATPTPTGGVDVTPTPTGGANVTPTPTSTGGVDVTPTPTGGANVTPTPTSTGGADVTPTPTPDANAVSLVVPGDRSGVKQGEELQLSVKKAASGDVLTGAQWSISDVTGVSISDDGLLTVEKTAKAGAKVKVTVTKDGSSDSCDLTVIENKVPVLKETEMQMNESTVTAPLGLTYRDAKAFETVEDPERGEVLKLDTSVANSNDSQFLAWLEIDPIYAGKRVTISGYMKYDAIPSITQMNLIVNEAWNYSNPAAAYNKESGKWFYVSGTYTLPGYDTQRYDGTKNRLYICRDVNLPSGVNAVYYIDDLRFTVEKSSVASVELNIADDATEVYQDHTLKCSATVQGDGSPSQLVDYTIDPPVDGVSISDKGVLTVAKNAQAGAEINIKATSRQDSSKSATKEVTILAQTINTIKVSAEGSPTEIYQNNEQQFTAAVTSSGEPDEAVTWSVAPSENVTITRDGLLQVGEVPGGTVLKVKATSVFDKSKSDEYPITVRANEVTDVKIETAGNQTTVDAGDRLVLNTILNVKGTPDRGVTWVMKEDIEGVSLSAATGSSVTLIVEEKVKNDTEITIRATSDFNKNATDEVTITVVNTVSEEFNLNKLTVSYWEDFETNNTEESLKDTPLSYSLPTLSGDWEDFNYTKFPRNGVDKLDDPTALPIKKISYALNTCLAGDSDYLQIEVANDTKQEKTYTLSLMVSFNTIAGDTISTPLGVEYKLPLKLVADDGKQETTLSTKELPYRCNTNAMNNRELYEIFGEVKIPGETTYNLKLKLAGALPECQTSSHEGKHPVVIAVDNIAVSSGNQNTITLDTSDNAEYQLQLNTVTTDTVRYYTNCYLSKYTHENKKPVPVGDTRLGEDSLVATVDADGKVTALNAGETILIAEITHADGSVERKQCIVHVDAGTDAD